MMNAQHEQFWLTKSLAAMSREEWESLCDGCGRCCLVKLEDDENGEVSYTDIACRLLDCDTCQCKDYAARNHKVPDCLPLTPEKLASIDWLPPTCAYRLVAEGRDLYWWHPLVSGDRSTVHEAGMSVRGRVVSETLVDDADYSGRVVQWPVSAASPEWPETHARPAHDRNNSA